MGTVFGFGWEAGLSYTEAQNTASEAEGKMGRLGGESGRGVHMKGRAAFIRRFWPIGEPLSATNGFAKSNTGCGYARQSPTVLPGFRR